MLRGSLPVSASQVRPALRVGTRGSALARHQTDRVVGEIAARHPDVDIEVVEVPTVGDRDRDAPVERLGVGVFVSALEQALADGRVDLVVHSLKDLPSKLDASFEIAAVTVREDPREALVNRWGVTLEALPPGARIGTGSPRRKAQLLAFRPDLAVLPMRGNVDTRLRKAAGSDGGGYDGAVLAAAGLARLDRLTEVSEFLDPARFVPAPGQGALAVEIRAGDSRARDLMGAVADAETTQCATAERAFLARLEAGCTLPVAAYATVHAGELRLAGFVSDRKGTNPLMGDRAGSPQKATETGSELAEEMIRRGALELLHGAVRG